MFGQRLRLARKRAGLSMQALAERVTPNVSAQAISKYEADKMMPSSSVLVGLGKALGVSLDFLLGGQVEALESVEWRKNSTASAQDRAMAESIVIEKLEDYLAIEDILDMHPAEDPFAALRVDMVADEEAIDAKARDVRREWQLGIDPIPSWSVDPSSMRPAMCLAIRRASSLGAPWGASMTARSLGTSMSMSRTLIKQSPSDLGMCSQTSATTNRALSAADLTMSVETP